MKKIDITSKIIDSEKLNTFEKIVLLKISFETPFKDVDIMEIKKCCGIETCVFIKTLDGLFDKQLISRKDVSISSDDRLVLNLEKIILI